MNTWRKVRVVIEVPSYGNTLSEKDLAWEVKRLTEHNAKFLAGRGRKLGRALVKEFSRVAELKKIEMKQ